MTLTPEQRELLNEGQLAEYDASDPEQQAHVEAAIAMAEQLEALPIEEKVNMLMSITSKLVVGHNQVIDRIDQLVELANHHSQVIQLVLTTVNGRAVNITNINTPSPVDKPLEPGGTYL